MDKLIFIIKGNMRTGALCAFFQFSFFYAVNQGRKRYESENQNVPVDGIIPGSIWGNRAVMGRWE